jgi:hypothetical protein
LFFLDEATAFAAGHRPCFFCRYADAQRFRAAWAAGNAVDPPAAPLMDKVLHAERLDGKRKRLHPIPGAVADLPDGAVLAAGAASFLILGGRALRWSSGGYQRVTSQPTYDGLLTPPSTLRAFAAGYLPVLHPSAGYALASKPLAKPDRFDL